MKRNLIAIFLLAFTTHSALALEETLKNYRGPRSLAMGGVVTTTGNFDEALFGNPATQAEDEHWKISVINVTAEMNSNLTKDMAKLKSIQGASGAGALANASDLIGRNEHLRLTLLPGAYFPHFFADKLTFAFGILLNVQTNLMVRSDVDIETQLVTDAGPNVGVGYKFLDDRLNVGLNLHLLYRLASDQAIQATSFLSGKKPSLSDLGGQGAGIDADIGAYYKIPFELLGFKPSVGFSVNNIFRSTYSLFMKNLVKKITTTPPTNDRSFNLGFRIDFPNLLILKKTLVAAEIQDMGPQSHQVSNWKRIHLGAETHLLFNFFAIRAGLNQGYFGGGVGIDWPFLKLDFTTYGEELGSNSGMLEDRRYLVRLCLDI